MDLSPTVCPHSGDDRRLAPAAEATTRLERYRGTLASYLRRKGFSAEEADDLTQETLIRAYTHVAGFRGASPAAWLYRIAANVAVDHLRRQRLKTVTLDSAPESPVQPDMLRGVLAAERSTTMAGVIRELPPCHQRILHLRYFEDRSVAEIAGAMNCSTVAAKLRVFRAVTALRKRCATLGAERELLAG